MVKGHTGYIADQDIFLASIDFLSFQGFVQMLGIGGFKWHHVRQGVLGTVACEPQNLSLLQTGPGDVVPTRKWGLASGIALVGREKLRWAKRGKEDGGGKDHPPLPGEHTHVGKQKGRKTGGRVR